MASPLTKNVSVTTVAPGESAPSVDVWVVTLMAILGIVGVIGNSLVCLIILRAKFLHNLTNYLILSLAIADLSASFLIVVNLFPLEAGIVTGPPSGWLAAELYCRFYNSRHFFWVSVTASVFNLVCVTFERFFAIVYPLHYPMYFTLRKVQIMIFMCWTLSNVQEAFAFFINPYNSDKHDCDYGFRNAELHVYFGVFVFLVSYFVPLVIMIAAYTLIFLNLKRDSHSGDMSQTQVQVDSMSQARKKVVQVLLIVVIAFMVLWTPNQVIYLFQNLGWTILDPQDTFYEFFRLTAFSNSVINPFIYAFKYRQFRRGFRIAICDFSKNQVGFSAESSNHGPATVRVAAPTENGHA